MKLAQLLKPWINENAECCDIKGINNDSRLVEPGDLFIAYPGAAADGRLFINNAIALGAVAVAYDPDNFPSNQTLPIDIPCVAVQKLGAHLAEIAQRFYNNPSQLLSVTGITGTNGKTTIAYQLAQAHNLLAQNAAYIGTIGQGPVDRLQDMGNTTPDALRLQRLLQDYKQADIKQVCMEVSSHALTQRRVDFVEFDQAIFTNLTLDHLDYHKTMEAYAAAKAELFAYDSLQVAIINQDDSYQHLMTQALKPHVKRLSYGIHQECDVKALNWYTNMQGTHIDVDSPWGQFTLKISAIGQFNIYNSLAIFTSLMASSLYKSDEVVAVMSRLKAAPGRMEIVSYSPYTLVDYAHTPDALEKALKTLQELKKGDLWVIFGCGGDRDKSKRPVMGRVASLNSDKMIITSDNPRSENPQVIINEIMRGICSDKTVIQLENRQEAIGYALKNANCDDIILIAGKGHEAYQQIGSVKYAFSDQDIIRGLCKEHCAL